MRSLVLLLVFRWLGLDFQPLPATPLSLLSIGFGFLGIPGERSKYFRIEAWSNSGTTVFSGNKLRYVSLVKDCEMEEGNLPHRQGHARCDGDRPTRAPASDDETRHGSAGHPYDALSIDRFLPPLPVFMPEQTHMRPGPGNPGERARPRKFSSASEGALLIP